MISNDTMPHISFLWFPLFISICYFLDIPFAKIYTRYLYTHFLRNFEVASQIRNVFLFEIHNPF